MKKLFFLISIGSLLNAMERPEAPKVITMDLGDVIENVHREAAEYGERIFCCSLGLCMKDYLNQNPNAEFNDFTGINFCGEEMLPLGLSFSAGACCALFPKEGLVVGAVGAVLHKIAKIRFDQMKAAKQKTE